MKDHILYHVVFPLTGRITYKGVIVDKVRNGYEVLNQFAQSPYEVDRIIDEAANNLNETIQIVKKK